MAARNEKVKGARDETTAIRRVNEDIAKSKDRPLLISLGIDDSDCCDKRTKKRIGKCIEETK